MKPIADSIVHTCESERKLVNQYTGSKALFCQLIRIHTAACSVCDAIHLSLNTACTGTRTLQTKCTYLDLAEWLERLTANAEVVTVLGSIPASSDTVKSEGRQMKQC
jgi:hypothetical protein